MLSSRTVRAIRALPGAAIALIGVFGLVFPDQVKWPQSADSTGPSTAHRPLSHRPSLPMMAIVLGGLVVVGAFIKDVTEVPIDPEELSRQQFLERYTEAISETILSLPYVKAMTAPEKSQLIQNTLKNICSIAEAYKNDIGGQRHRINACLYLPTDPSAAKPEQLQWAKEFMDPGRNLYKTYLVLSQWGRLEGRKTGDPNNAADGAPCVPVGFTLPVDDDARYTLFGAPLAFRTRRAYMVKDIQDRNAVARLPGTIHAPVRDYIIGFFAARSSYRSFISVPIMLGNKPLGVVCIQSAQKCFCQIERKDGKKMLKLIEPFLAALASALSG